MCYNICEKNKVYSGESEIIRTNDDLNWPFNAFGLKDKESHLTLLRESDIDHPKAREWIAVFTFHAPIEPPPHGGFLFCIKLV